MMKLIAPLILMFGLLAPTSATSAVIWDESINGSSVVLPTLTLGVGSNEFLGSSRSIGSYQDPFTFTERDWFSLVLEDGLTIWSMQTEILNPVWITTRPFEEHFASAEWTLRQEPAGAFNYSDFTLLGEAQPRSRFTRLPVSQTGRYRLNQASGLGFGPGDEWDISWQYRVVIDVVETPVVPVSEPASVLLGITGLIAFRRARKRHRVLTVAGPN